MNKRLAIGLDLALARVNAQILRSDTNRQRNRTGSVRGEYWRKRSACWHAAEDRLWFVYEQNRTTR